MASKITGLCSALLIASATQAAANTDSITNAMIDCITETFDRNGFSEIPDNRFLMDSNGIPNISASFTAVGDNNDYVGVYIETGAHLPEDHSRSHGWFEISYEGGTGQYSTINYVFNNAQRSDATITQRANEEIIKTLGTGISKCLEL